MCTKKDIDRFGMSEQVHFSLSDLKWVDPIKIQTYCVSVLMEYLRKSEASGHGGSAL